MNACDGEQCRDEAREGARPGLRRCKRAFRRCLRETCPPEAPVDRDHACVEACRATRAECRQPFVDALDAAVALCAADRDAAITVCKQLHDRGSEARDRCIDAARELVKPDLAACRQAFRSCAEACPPPGGSPSGAFVR